MVLIPKWRNVWLSPEEEAATIQNPNRRIFCQALVGVTVAAMTPDFLLGSERIEIAGETFAYWALPAKHITSIYLPFGGEAYYNVVYNECAESVQLSIDSKGGLSVVNSRTGRPLKLKRTGLFPRHDNVIPYAAYRVEEAPWKLTMGTYSIGE